MKRVHGVLGWLVLVLTLGATRADALSIAFTPALAGVAAGQLVSLSIDVSGLGDGVLPSLSAFDLDVGYDPAVLLPVDVIFGDVLGVVGIDAFSSWQILTGQGAVDLALASLLDSATLEANQPGAFSLATLVFRALTPGVSLVYAEQATFADTSNVPGGNEIPVDEATGALVAVAVPEPGSLALLAGGVAVLALQRRRRAP